MPASGKRLERPWWQAWFSVSGGRAAWRWPQPTASELLEESHAALGSPLASDLVSRLALESSWALRLVSASGSVLRLALVLQMASG